MTELPLAYLRAASSSFQAFFRRLDPPDVRLVRQRLVGPLPGRIRARPVHRVGLGPKMRQHVVSDPRLALVAERRYVHRPDDDPPAPPRRGARQAPAPRLP